MHEVDLQAQVLADLDRAVVPLRGVDVEAEVREEGEGLISPLLAGLPGRLEEGEVVGKREQAGSRTASAAAEPTASGLLRDLLGRALRCDSRCRLGVS